MKDRVFRITTIDGIKVAFKAAYALMLTLPFKGGYELVIRELKSKRSQSQNKRYWAILREIAAGLWMDGRQYSDTVWHEYFARQFIGCIDLPGGGQSSISTTTLSIAEFGDYMTQVEQFAAANGVPLE